MNITLVQTKLHWENIEANLEMFSQKLQKLPQTDLIILPEMFTTGFSMNAAALAEPMGGSAIQWMQEQAQQHQAVVTGSLIIEENGNYYNRLIWMRPDGSYQQYDKKHLFTMAKEEETYTAGEEKILIEYKGFKICPFICYDLRFPVWNRNTQDYDLALYVANWPAKRSYHWRSLLLARAIENQAYIAAVNRVGEDGKGFYYSGDSALIDPAGEILYQKADEEDIFQATISLDHIKEVREKLPFLKDRD
jgi:omega-amidase